MRKTKIKKLNITKEQFNRSRYFKNKYGKLEYVSESGDVYKTNKGEVLMFVKESKNLSLKIEKPKTLKFKSSFNGDEKIELNAEKFADQL